MRRLAASVVLLACAGAVLAQSNTMPREASRNQEWTGRVPRDGVAPLLDIRLQDAGITMPAEHKPDDAPAKPVAKPEAAPAPRPSEQPAPPAPSK